MIVIVPLAGRGARFAERGITTPKPFITVSGRPMIYWALQSLRNVPHSKVIFVALAEHEAEHAITDRLLTLVDVESRVILLDGITEGQLCTVLAARELIDTEEDLLIAGADTMVISNLGQDIALRAADCRGIISVADMPGARWSFARVDTSGRVVEVSEKVRISDYASTGLYYFSNGREFVAVADDMIRNSEKTQGEHYVIPVYQKYIQRGWQVDIAIATDMLDMGTPEALLQSQLALADQPYLRNHQ